MGAASAVLDVAGSVDAAVGDRLMESRGSMGFLTMVRFAAPVRLA